MVCLRGWGWVRPSCSGWTGLRFLPVWRCSWAWCSTAWCWRVGVGGRRVASPGITAATVKVGKYTHFRTAGCTSDNVSIYWSAETGAHMPQRHPRQVGGTELGEQLPQLPHLGRVPGEQRLALRLPMRLHPLEPRHQRRQRLHLRR
ncbi:hypothetical protein ACU686_09585 [Yinghuangia aomiensis]